MSTRPVHDWDDSYAGEPAPWDIGRPQPAILRLADAGELSGAVLDAGCGTGEHTILASQRASSALGIDISARAIDLARRKAEDRGATATFKVHDALELRELGESFDTVIDSGLFHCFDDADRITYVRELAGVVRPGGRVLLMCFSDRQPGDWGPRRVTERELRASFADGWRVDALSADRFEINPVHGATVAVAWQIDVRRIART